jgi:hypothetical protein
MVFVLTTLPSSDASLAALLQHTTSVHLARDNTKLLEVVRVVRGARELKALKVSSVALLREGEKDAVYGGDEAEAMYHCVDAKQSKRSLWDLERALPPAAPAMEELCFTGTVQAGCVRQMEWVTEMLRGAANLKVLKLHVYEFDTEELITELRAMDVEGEEVLASMLNFARPGSRRTLTQRQNEEEGRKIGQMMVDAILKNHSQRLRIEDRPRHEMERLMEELLSASLPSEEDPLETALVAQFHSDAAMMATTTGGLSLRRPVLKCMTYEQYDDVLQPLFATQLPEGLEHLTMRAILKGSRVQAQFLFLPRLRTLDLDHCEMDDAAFAILGPVIGRRMPALLKLSLRQNRLQDAQLGVAVGPCLEEIDLAQNPISSGAASHLFRSMEDNAALHAVDLAHTRIDRTVSFHGLHRWCASPARLRIPYCFSDEELVRASRFMHPNVELELIAPTTEELARCGVQMLEAAK